MRIHRYVGRFAATAAMAALVAAGGLVPAGPVLAADLGVQTADARQVVPAANGWGPTLGEFWPSLTTNFYFFGCDNSTLHGKAIWLEDEFAVASGDGCGGIPAGDFDWGFGSITTTALGNHWVEVCNYTTNFTMALRVEVAGPNGESTGQVLEYDDPPGGGCYKEIKGYPMRKWRVGVIYASGTPDFSGWTVIPA